MMGTEIYHTLKDILKSKNLSTGVGDEGGFAPNLESSEEALDLLVQAIEAAGYKTKEEVAIAMDCAASEIYDEDEDVYYFAGESKMTGREIRRNSEEMVQYYEKLTEQYPIFSIEDGLNEEDMTGWKVLTYRLGEKILLVGDDLFVTNVERLKEGIKEDIANSILVKLNQIGTLTETLDAVEVFLTDPERRKIQRSQMLRWQSTADLLRPEHHADRTVQRNIISFSESKNNWGAAADMAYTKCKIHDKL